MKKKKESKTFLTFFRYTARIWIISMPAAIILATLFLFEKISWGWALGLLAVVVVVSAIIATSVLKEIEEFITYLKTLAQGFEIDPPHFQKGIFSSKRLAETFQSVKKRWSNQTLSDGRILMHLPNPMLMLDETGKIVFMNDKAKSVFGERYFEKVGKEIFEEKWLCVKKVLQEQSANELFEWVKGDETYQVCAERLPAPTRNQAIVVVTFNDITPFKQFRKQQSEFFANASHELKTPLSIISGVVETLQGPAKNDREAQESFLNMISEQTSRMTYLVQDLLALSRQKGVLSAEQKSMILVGDMLQRIGREFQVKAQAKGQKIQVKIERKLPKVFGNKTELRHAVQNLIDNAIKYGSEKTTITLAVRKKRNKIEISVHNWGDPIEAKHLGKLFDRFYRVNSIATKEVVGTGLGLSIVQQIIHDHGGDIEVMSSQKKGTIFTIYLPIAE